MTDRYRYAMGPGEGENARREALGLEPRAPECDFCMDIAEWRGEDGALACEVHYLSCKDEVAPGYWRRL